MRLMQTDAVWHHGQTLAAGQVAEFKVWSELIRQSTGGLHIFLPLRDRGIDGVVHRLQDGVFASVQVKARTELTPAGQVHITVTERSLADDSALSQPSWTAIASARWCWWWTKPRFEVSRRMTWSAAARI